MLPSQGADQRSDRAGGLGRRAPGACNDADHVALESSDQASDVVYLNIGSLASLHGAPSVQGAVKGGLHPGDVERFS